MKTTNLHIIHVISTISPLSQFSVRPDNFARGVEASLKLIIKVSVTYSSGCNQNLCRMSTGVKTFNSVPSTREWERSPVALLIQLLLLSYRCGGQVAGCAKTVVETGGGQPIIKLSSSNQAKFAQLSFEMNPLQRECVLVWGLYLHVVFLESTRRRLVGWGKPISHKIWHLLKIHKLAKLAALRRKV